MSLSSLNRAVNSLVLGNKTVYNFIDYIGGIHITGGIKRYTAARGYYLNNISYNYDRGLIGRYGYGNYIGSAEEQDARDKIEGTDGVLTDGITPAVLFQSKIGDYYGLDGTERNSERKFITINEFGRLGDELRWGNTSYNIPQNVFEYRYGDENYKFSPNEKSAMNASSDLGDEYSTNEKPPYYINLFGPRKELRLTNVEYRENARAVNTIYEPHNSDDYRSDLLITTGVAGKDEIEYENNDLRTDVKDKDKKFSNIVFKTDFKKDILNIGVFVRNRYFRTRISNKVVDSSANNNISIPYPYYIDDSWGGGESMEYGDMFGYEGSPIFVNPSAIDIPEGGLFDYYEDLFNWYDSLKKRYRGFSMTSPYAVFSIAHEKYSVPNNGEEYKASRFSPANHTITGRTGAFRVGSHDPIGFPYASYNYYEEVDGKTPVTESHPDGVSDGFVPFVTSFSNASNLIRKTNDLFRSGQIRTLVNRFHTDTDAVDKEDFLVSSYSDVGISHGRNLLRGDSDKNTGFDNPYCRVWTAHHQYSKLKNRIRPFMDGDNFMSIKELQDNLGRLRPNNGAQRLNDYSVLQENGYVKISPYHDGNGNLAGGRDSLKKYMFSIENLAWKDFATKENLSNEQIGPFGGRIMWFPPYNLKFNENINTSWRDNEFIGRGEKIYTYTNTERGGTLDFTLLIDHPSIINKASNMGESNLTDEDILRFFAGCGVLDVVDKEEEEKKEEGGGGEDNEDNTNPTLRPDAEHIEFGYVIFYPNNFSAKKYYGNMDEVVKRLDEYEMSSDGSSFTEMDEAWERQKLAEMNYDSKSLFNLNRGLWDSTTASHISDLLDIKNIENYEPYSRFKKLNEKYKSGSSEGETGIMGYPSDFYELEEIEVRGFASSHGYDTANDILSSDRANTIAKLALHFCGSLDASKIKTGKCQSIMIQKEGMADDVNDVDAKIARSAVITFKLKLKEDAKAQMDQGGEEGFQERLSGTSINEDNVTAEGESGTTVTETQNGVQEVVSTAFHSEGDKSYYTYQNEFMYFKQLEATDNLVYKKIVDKVKFFDPAFHSMTPEGFNARLNFLHQCTRQGPTIGTHAGNKNPDKSKYSEMAGNLAFGRAPYCILRVGDFFYSKIIIDSISINYDNNGGVQWDLNPEGVGVQPMMATVNISFKFVGGQDIDGPVQQLQNAISYNYYANSSIYTPSTQQSIPTVILEDENTN